MEAYEQVQKGPLKLKGVAELGVTKRKKKKKDKDKAKLLEAMGTSKKNEEEKRRGLDKRTPAQAAFEKMQEKRWLRICLPQGTWVPSMVRELRSTYLGAAKPVCSKAACMAVKTPNAATKTQCSQKKKRSWF
ncbi:protein FAM32A isoform X1 [Ovis aries]|uniref:protein FAM32A isoform X1 n=1 Tax=Ovis aries TaxID=9940 RepID=UPI0005FB2775|nr:protein FAM32A isoform X1 [Ovis aries]